MRTQDFYKDTYIIRNVDFLYVNKHNIETLVCSAAVFSCLHYVGLQ